MEKKNHSDNIHEKKKKKELRANSEPRDKNLEATRGETCRIPR